MNKIPLLLLIAGQVFLAPNLLQAACNQSTDPKVFKIHGTRQKRKVIKGDCLKELHNAIGEEKHIDIMYAEIREANFSGAKFAGEANFYGTHFAGKANFRFAKFAGKANFWDAKFDEWADFGYAQFTGKTYFWMARFDKEANFWNAQFPGEAYFGHALFAGKANFGRTQFAGEVDFYGSQFAGGARFGGAQFADRANFDDAQFAGKANFLGARFADCSFNGAWFGIKSGYTERYLTRKNMQKIKDKTPRLEKGLDRYFLSKEKKIKAAQYSITNFKSATFTKFADFRNALFLGNTEFNEAKFKEVGLFDGAFFFNAQTLGLVDKNNEESLVYLSIDDSYFNLWKGVSYDQIFPHLHKRLKYTDNEGREQFIEPSIENYIYLQENFRKIGRFEDADKIYYKRRVLENEKEWGFWNYFLDITCKYGTSFTRILLVCVGIIFFFAIWYFVSARFFSSRGEIKIHDREEAAEEEPLSFWHAFYLSVTTFTTVGTGDIIATGYLRWLVLLEGALGWFMLGLFIVVFAAQYIR